MLYIPSPLIQVPVLTINITYVVYCYKHPSEKEFHVLAQNGKITSETLVEKTTSGKLRI